MDEIFIIDIESSGLGIQSYPIEIAYSNLDGSIQDSFLINPETSPRAWSYWDNYAETDIHKIPRSLLISHGISVFEASKRINSALKNKRVYSDACQWDQDWIDELFYVTNKSSLFRLSNVFDLVDKSLKEIMKTEIRNSNKSHRALGDVELIRSLLVKFLS